MIRDLEEVDQIEALLLVIEGAVEAEIHSTPTETSLKVLIDQVPQVM